MNAQSRLELDKIAEEVYSTRIGELPVPGTWPQPGYFGEEAKFLFLGQNPGIYGLDKVLFEFNRDENLYIQSVIQSPTGKLIMSAVSEAGFGLKDIAYTNIMKCPTPGNRAPTEEELSFYSPYFLRQLEALQPDKIVVFGAVARSWFWPDFKKNVPLRLGYHVLLVDHPSYVLRIGNSIQFIQLISKFLKEEYDKVI